MPSSLFSFAMRKPFGLTLALLAAAWVSISVYAGDEARVVEQRLTEKVALLASPECEGRAVGRPGIDRAAEFIAEQFAAVGLRTDLVDGKPFQTFSVPLGNVLGPENQLAFVRPARQKTRPEAEGIEDPANQEATIRAEIGTHFTTTSLSAAAEFDAPLVFAGYGIAADQEGYNDYQGIDATGKILIVLRHEPRQDDPDCPLDGTRDSIHATIGRKLAQAESRGAKGIIFVTDEVEVRRNRQTARTRWLESVERLSTLLTKAKTMSEASDAEFVELRKEIDGAARRLIDSSKFDESEFDPLLRFSMAGSSARRLVVLHCRRSLIDQVVQAALGKTLSELETEIDRDFRPRSAELSGWRAVGRTDLGRKQVEAKNVVALLPGDGPSAQETIVVGAHYDHLGFGDYGSLERRPNLLHPGADDNASGVAAMLEIARQLASRPRPLPRSVLFIAFSAEELGLLGSKHYVAHPIVPLEKTAAMINFDMVGRLRNERLTVFGVGTSELWPNLIQRVVVEGVKVNAMPGGAGSSDQLPFYLNKIPALHIYTGMHNEYHRASDTLETLNVAGMRKIVDWSVRLIEELAAEPERPKFAEGRMLFPGAHRRVTFGAVPEAHDREGTDGFRLAGIVMGGPAERAGLRSGDVVIEFGERKISNFFDFMEQLAKYQGGEKVKTVVRRGDEVLTFEVELEKRQ